MANPISNLINAYFASVAGGKKRNTFFSIEEINPGLRILDKNYSLILKEWEGLGYRKVLPYHEVDAYQKVLAQAEKLDDSWRVFMLYLMGQTPPEAQKQCPETLKLLRKIPHLFQAFFSVLPPGKSIPAHKGSYKGYLRYHLGIKVPQVDPPMLKINGKEYTWKEEESVFFDDSWEHEVINRATQERVVLVVDVLRPMPQPAHFLNAMLVKMVIRPFYARKLMQRLQEN